MVNDDPSPSSASEPTPTLAYARERSHFLKRHRRLLTWVVIAIAMLGVGYRYGPSVARQVQMAYLESRMSRHVPSADFALQVKTPQPLDGHSPQVTSRHSITNQTHEPWAKYVDAAALIRWPSLFLGKRSAGGPARLLHVYVAGSHQVGKTTPGGAVFCLVADVYEPATWTSAPKLVRRNVSLGLWVPNKGDLTVFAAQRDETNASQLRFRYRADGKIGVVYMQLRADDSVGMTVIEGNAVQVDARPL